MTVRPQKPWRLNYWGDIGDAEPHMSLLGDPGEARIGVGAKTFISVKEDSITLGGGFPSRINVQGLSSSFKYAGMIKPVGFPLSLIPSTIFTPFPRERFEPPLRESLGTIRQTAIIATSLIGA